MIITPAIIPEDYIDLEGKLSRLVGLSPYVQIDACDGKFTPKASWPYTNDREGVFELILDQERGLPHWDDFEFEVDMMVRYPEVEYERWINAGASRMVVHHYLGQQEKTLKILSDIEAREVEAVVAFHLSTPIEEMYEWKNIQLMGIKNIGFQSQPFEPETLERIKALKKKFPNTKISIDGGVNEDTAPLLAEAGADRLIIGSALFKSDDLEDAYDFFESL